MEKAYFAAGCFWGIQQRFSQQEGIISTRVGYMGGKTQNPDYRSVCTGQTSHAETVEVVYDEKIVNFETILSYFFDWHNPTEVDRQGPDVGSQYRSAIFPVDKKQRALSQDKINVLNRSKKFQIPIATTIETAEIFWEAEAYHQHYLDKRGMSLREF